MGNKILIIKAPCEIKVPSTLKYIGNSINNELNNLSDKLSNFFYGSPPQQKQQESTLTFENIMINTGLNVNIPSDKALLVFGADNTSGLSIANGVCVLTESQEIIIPMHNTSPVEVVIKAGEIIGYGILVNAYDVDELTHKCTDATDGKINLNKE